MVAVRRAAVAALLSSLFAACGSGKHNPSCSAASDCPAGLVCQANECVAAGQCASTQLSCNNANQCPSGQDCVSNCCTTVSGCFRDGDCPATTPHCDLVSHTCKVCTANGQCPAGQICTGSGTCATGCSSKADCTDPALPACHASGSLSICSQCDTTSDCTDPAHPFCAANGTCSGCASNSECSGATPVCDTTTHTCAKCVDSGNSGGVNPNCAAPTPACKGDVCVVCNPGNNGTDTRNGACPAATPVCVGTTSFSCAACDPAANNSSTGVNPACPAATPTCNSAKTCVATLPTSFHVGGTVTSLVGSAVLQNNGGDDLTVTADGPFTFATTVNSNGAYAVTVKTQPAGQTCTIANGSGTATADVTDVTVTCATATAAPKVMVVRVDSTPSAATTAAAVFLDEFDTTAAGAALRTVTLPTAVAGSNQPLTMSNSTAEGSLSRSADGHYLTLTGYAAAPGTLTVTTTTAAAVNRVVGRIDAPGTVDTTTHLSDAFTGGNPRAATSVDGTAFWISGSSGTNGGMRYATLGATTSTSIAGSPSNMRHTHIWSNQLYVSSMSGTTQGILSVGTGAPPTSTSSAALLPGFPTVTNSAFSPYSFAVFDLDSTPGVETIYLASDSTPAAANNTLNIQKWKLASGTWSQVATFLPALTASAGARGMAALAGAGGVRIVASTNDTISRLVTFVDTGTSDTPAVTVLSTVATGFTYRGVAISPQ